MSSTASAVKDLYILRHGQATHNPRAEAEREKGCSFEEFLQFMKEDDSLDSELTVLGKEQARSVSQQIGKPAIECIVSSPLSRALKTADLAFDKLTYPNRVCYEGAREINGWLLNAKRRPASELSGMFAHWNFDSISEEDVLWTETVEPNEDCAARGVACLQWLMDVRPENVLALVTHGGFMKYLMSHPAVKVVDGRKASNTRDVHARFSNAELRRYRFERSPKASDGESTQFLLTEVDLESATDP